MKADKYRFDGARTCDLRALSCDGKEDATDKDEIPAKTAGKLQKMAALQDALQQCSRTYPQPDAAAQAAPKDCRTALEAER